MVYQNDEGLANPLLIGAHMSVAGGLSNAFDRAKTAGCRTMQIFTKNEKQWNPKPLEESDIASWNAAFENSAVWPVVSHDSYLINMATPKDDLWDRSISAFKEELYRCQVLKIPYLVTHAGAHTGAGEESGLARVAEALNRLFQECDSTAEVVTLLETTAGQGTSVGYKFEHLNVIFEKLDKPERVGVCFDTCHIFAAGYDITTPEGYRDTFEQFDRYAGIEKLKVFHINDSKKGLGSRVDRHEAIGEGEMGLEPFRFLMNDPRFYNIPKILETPKSPDGHEDIENLAKLRNLVGTLPV